MWTAVTESVLLQPRRRRDATESWGSSSRECSLFLERAEPDRPLTRGDDKIELHAQAPAAGLLLGVLAHSAGYRPTLT